MSTRTLRRSRNTSRYRMLRMARRMSRKLGALVSFVLSFAFVTTAQTQASARAALDGSARGAAITCITAYQNHVSPYKGFSCAYRVAYGGESCSAFVKRTIGEQGVGAAMASHSSDLLCAGSPRKNCGQVAAETNESPPAPQTRSETAGRAADPTRAIRSMLSTPPAIVSIAVLTGGQEYSARLKVSPGRSELRRCGCVDAGCAHCGVSDVACIGCL
jgi:putative component of membrane protein insertase Oxa1/YidC/SpoIIIJ protein YidD